MKTIALMLAVMVPSLAFAQQRERVVLVPSSDQPTPVAFSSTEVPADEVPLYRRWYTWVALGATLSTVAAVVAVGLAISANASRGPTLAETNARCGGQCDAFISKPPL
jgi:hypothetical protein